MDDYVLKTIAVVLLLFNIILIHQNVCIAIKAKTVSDFIALYVMTVWTSILTTLILSIFVHSFKY